MTIDQRLLGLYSLNFFINAANSILAPFYPDVAIDKGVSKDIIGFIFSSHPIASFLFSLLLGKMMHFWGRKKILILGLLLQSLGLATFGAVIHIPNKYLFIAISVVARTTQGIGLACYGSIAYAYIPLLYPDTVEKKISYMEILTGMGLMLGPLIGGLLFSLGGYQLPFYFMAGIFFFVTPFMLSRLPADSSFQHKDEKVREKPISLFKFLFNKKIFLTFLIVVLPNCGMCFLQPTLTNHLHDYTSSTLVISLMFSVGTLAYALSMPLISVLPKRIDRRVWLTIGIALSSISYFLMGPEPYFNFPNTIAWCILSLSLLGIGVALSMVPSIPEFMSIGNKMYPDEKEMVGDMSAGLFNSAYSAGALLGPILGGTLDENFGFARAESIYGIINVGYLIIYLTIGEGILAFGCFGRKEKKVALLDEENKEIFKDSSFDSDQKKNYDASTFNNSKDYTKHLDISPNMEISPDNQVTVVSPLTQHSYFDNPNTTIVSPIDYRSLDEKITDKTNNV